MKKGCLIFFIIFLAIEFIHADTAISDCAGLQNMGLTGNYYLTGNIDCNVAPYNAGLGFDPIGSSNNYFSGTFDGKGYTISNLYVDRLFDSTNYYCGLFGYVSGGVIKNVKMKNVFVKCVSSGGIIGFAKSGAIIDSCSVDSGNVIGKLSSGGFAGGFVGVAGQIDTPRVIFLNSYSNVNVSAYVAGGFVGTTGYSNYLRCYSAGKIIVPAGGSIGGFVAQMYDNIFSNCFWDKGSSGVTISAGCTGKTTIEMKKQSTFTNFDFTDIWKIKETRDYPRLKYETCTSEPISTTCGDWICGTRINNCFDDVSCGTCNSEEVCVNGQCVNYGIQKHNCDSNNDIIMRLFSSKNSHASLWNYEGNGWEICYKDYFGETGNANRNCNGKNQLISLFQRNNSHAEIFNGINNYPLPICYGNLICAKKEHPQRCPESYKMIMKLYDSTNSHVLSYNDPINDIVTAYYPLELDPLDINPRDYSGNNLNAIAYGNPLIVDGKIDYGYNFDGTDDYIRAGGFVDLASVDKAYSISAWFKVANGETDGNLIHVSNLDDGTGWCLPPLTINNNKITATSYYDNHGYYAVDTSTISPNNWYHAVTTWDPVSKKLKLYVNGNLKAETTQDGYTASGAVNGNYIFIGFGPGSCIGDRGRFSGVIDEVKIRNFALTDKEVKAEYETETDGYKIKICCREETYPIPGNLLWKDMNGNNLIWPDDMQIGDSAKMAWENTALPEGAVLNIRLYEDKTGIDREIRDYSSKVNSIETGSSKWLITTEDYNGNENEKKFYFYSPSPNNKYSNNLKVTNYFNNTFPVTRLISPIKNNAYIINPLTGLTGEVKFQQTSLDEDDDLKLIWKFGDGTETIIENALLNENGNTTHSYNRYGTKSIIFEASEMTRSQSVKNYSRIFVFREGYNIFAVIASPSSGFVTGPGYKLISGMQSFVNYCNFSESACTNHLGQPRNCFKVEDNSGEVNQLYCYWVAGADKLTFQWKFDGVIDTVHTNYEPFNHLFIEPTEHTVELNVYYTVP